MPDLVQGERLGKDARLSVECSALLLDAARQRVFLTRRTDNGRWCLPGGHVEPGETVSEGCVREVGEETGLQVRVVRLLGVYSTPDFVMVYPDGRRLQLVGLSFEVALEGGEPGPSQEVSAWGYFTPGELAQLDVMEHHRQRLDDFFGGGVTEAPVVR